MKESLFDRVYKDYIERHPMRAKRKARLQKQALYAGKVKHQRYLERKAREESNPVLNEDLRPVRPSKEIS